MSEADNSPTSSAEVKIAHSYKDTALGVGELGCLAGHEAKRGAKPTSAFREKLTCSFS